MAYVNIYYHRDPSRLGKHARYIAERPGSTGLHGLGPEFRALRGDVDASVRLLERHAAQARTQTGDGTREGPFVRMLFTLPTDLAQRVDASATLLSDGPRLVLRVGAGFGLGHLGGQGVVHGRRSGRAGCAGPGGR